jgi:aminopeptidase N
MISLTAARRAAMLCMLTVAATAARAGAPFSFDAAPGRLPKSIVPLDYTIAVTPDVAAQTIAGTESVTLRLRVATSTIVFNSLNERLADVRFDGTPVAATASDDARQLTTVRLAARAAAGTHTLTFSYGGRLETQPHGMFLQPYLSSDGVRSVLVSTKMESTDARRMFPCWDEPAFRATFALTVTVPATWATISNMPVAGHVVKGALATTTFQRTPQMPSYLIEFTGGDLAEVSGPLGATALGVWAMRGRESDGAVALANARQILADYNTYFDYPFPLPKLDSIAVPGGFSGAMENWGAITYNDQLLLYRSSSTLADLETTYAVQAHEMAHQWNGDLVTMGWWDDLWLNESFASWRGAKETDERNPGWKWAEQQDVSKERAMRGDARASSHPIEQHVADELQAANAFDEITYDKGAAVLRMFEAYLGPDVFRDGVRRYIRARAYSNATAADLWSALSAASGQDVGALARDWTEQAGFPLVTVGAHCAASGARTLTLSEQRFLLSGPGAAGARWRVPLRIRSGPGAPRAVLLTRNGQQAPAGRCDETLGVNADAIGFYRVKYDAATLATDTRLFGTVPDADRIVLLDDTWALVTNGADELRAYLALAGAMGTDMDSRAWQQIAAALGAIEKYERGSTGHAAFASFARSVIKPVADRLGWDPQPGEGPDMQELRRALLGDLGAWGDPQAQREALSRFTAFAADRKAIPPDDQALVLGIVARGADAATFDRLHAIARSETDDSARRRDFLALMQVGDAQLAARAAQIALSPEIPPQDALTRLRLVVALADQHPQLSWATFTANADLLLSTNPKYAPLITAQQVPEIYWNAVTPEKLEAWVRARVPAEMSVNVERGMETARAERAEQARLVREADAWLATASRTPSG